MTVSDESDGASKLQFGEMGFPSTAPPSVASFVTVDKKAGLDRVIREGLGLCEAR